MDAVRRPQHSSLPGVSSWGWETAKCWVGAPSGLAVGRWTRAGGKWAIIVAQNCPRLGTFPWRPAFSPACFRPPHLVLTTNSVLPLPRSLPRLLSLLHQLQTADNILWKWPVTCTVQSTRTGTHWLVYIVHTQYILLM